MQPPPWGRSGVILLNSPMGCEGRRDRSGGNRDEPCGGPCRRNGLRGWGEF